MNTKYASVEQHAPPPPQHVPQHIGRLVQALLFRNVHNTVSQRCQFIVQEQSGHYPRGQQIVDVFQKRFLFDLRVAEQKHRFFVFHPGQVEQFF